MTTSFDATPAGSSPSPAGPTILIAPDSFKGTFPAPQAAEILAEGIREEIADAAITCAPMADGGEGTAALFPGETVTLPTLTAGGRLEEASYVLDRAAATAYIDVAAASGLTSSGPGATATTGDTFGTGVLIADALSRGSRRIVLALGGSATVDGGTGILSALGARWLTERGVPAAPGGAWLGSIASVDTAKLNPQLVGAQFVLLADVTAPATGESGAARVFGPQKGATPEDIDCLEEGLTHLCNLLEVDPETPGMGAAGGIPIALSWLGTLLEAPTQIVAGAPVVADATGLTAALPRADLLITGEGRLDPTSLGGKVIGHLAGLAAHYQVPLGLACGQADRETLEHLRAGLPQLLVAELAEPTDSAASLRAAGARIARGYLSISTHQG